MHSRLANAVFARKRRTSGDPVRLHSHHSKVCTIEFRDQTVSRALSIPVEGLEERSITTLNILRARQMVYEPSSERPEVSETLPKRLKVSETNLEFETSNCTPNGRPSTTPIWPPGAVGARRGVGLAQIALHRRYRPGVRTTHYLELSINLINEPKLT